MIVPMLAGLALLQSLTAPTAAGWIAVDQEAQGTMAYLPSSVRRSGTAVSTLIRVRNPNGTMVARMRIDCAARTGTGEYNDIYGPAGAFLRGGTPPPQAARPTPITAGSPVARVFDRVCAAR